MFSLVDLSAPKAAHFQPPLSWCQACLDNFFRFLASARASVLKPNVNRTPSCKEASPRSPLVRRFSFSFGVLLYMGVRILAARRLETVLFPDTQVSRACKFCFDECRTAAGRERSRPSSPPVTTSPAGTARPATDARGEAPGRRSGSSSTTGMEWQ